MSYITPDRYINSIASSLLLGSISFHGDERKALLFLQAQYDWK
jgi:hypothetical protein